MVPPPGRRRRAHHIMAPKKRKSAPDWRETLFFWRGELRHEPDASEIVWSGKWVGSSDLELPSAQSFAESPNTFELRGHVKVTPPVEWAFREQHAYMLSGLTTPLVGSYLLDGESTKDDEHHLRLATLAPDEKSPMTTIAAAVGDTRFGRFISLGKVTRQAAVPSGAGASDASEPATSSGCLILLLVRRYVDRRDPRSKLASPACASPPACALNLALDARCAVERSTAQARRAAAHSGADGKEFPHRLGGSDAKPRRRRPRVGGGPA